MSILDIFKRKPQTGTFAFQELIPGIRSNPPTRGTREFLQLWSTSPWIRAVVSKISYAVSVTEWEAYQKKGKKYTQLEDHPILDFLARGGGRESYTLDGRSCMELTQKHLELTGEAFWVLERNGVGMPIGFVPLAPHWVTDIAKPHNPRYQVQIQNGWNGDIPMEDVVYFRDVDPLNPYERGVSIASALADELNTDEFASKHISSFLANRARPDIIISGSKEAPIPKDGIERLESSWANKFKGPLAQGKPFISSGPLSVTTLTQDFSQLQLSELRKMERDIIVSVFGVPPEKIGILISSNKASIDSAEEFFRKDLVIPKSTRIRDTINNQVSPMFDEKLFLDFESPLEEDRQYQLQVMTTAPYMFTQRQWQEAAGFDVPEDNSMDVYMVPFSLMPMSKLQPAAKQVDAPAKALKYLRKDIRQEDIDGISDALNQPEVMTNISKLVENARKDLVTALGQNAINDIEAGLNFELNSRVSDFISATTGEKITMINDVTRQRVKASLEQVMQDGFTQESAVNKINDIFENEARARLIAQTESTQLSGFAADEAFKQANVEKSQWLTTRDGAERESHAFMDGQVTLVGEDFKSGAGNTAQYPGAFGVAAEDINCRCAVVAYFDGVERSKEALDLMWLKKDRERQIAENNYFTVQTKVFNIQKEAVLGALKRALDA
jgi:HK97 family phage portal protein